ncbi:MAG: hypothetical protein EXR71_10690 [Myxococcales bacterium]|nr:hypothetical protein [Myxococcales bacterium]
MPWLFLLQACPQKIPPGLELIPTGAAVEVAEPADLAAWRRWLLAGDPLARRLTRPVVVRDPGYAVWARLPPDAAPDAVWFLEASAAGTASVALLRGARLAGAETMLADPTGLTRWLLPLAEPGAGNVEAPRGPLAWLGSDRADAALPVLERAVLLGWLGAPDIDTSAVAALLGDDAWARLATTPAGQLLLGRNGDAASPSELGRRVLADVTMFALEEAAADSAKEHAALKARRLALAGADGEDVVATRLERALRDLTLDARDDGAAGMALVAHAALRWRGRCPDLPCGGFDRMDQLRAAARFGPEPARLAAVWRTVAWKSAVDELWAAWDRPQVVRAMDRIVELAADAAPRELDRSIVVRPEPDAAWILPVTRAVGGPEATSKEGLFRALYGRVAVEAHAAASVAPQAAAALGRIERRAGR